jgi:hypothetical protein
MAQAADPGQEKLKAIENLEYKSSNGIILFNEKNY